MAIRPVLGALGAGLSTVLLVTVALIETLDVAFSAIIALPIGIVVGVLAATGIIFTHSRMGPAIRRAVSGYAAFGGTVFFVALLRYVNIGGLRYTISVSAMVLLGVGVAVLVYLVLPVRDTRG